MGDSNNDKKLTLKELRNSINSQITKMNDLVKKNNYVIYFYHPGGYIGNYYYPEGTYYYTGDSDSLLDQKVKKYGGDGMLS